MRMTRMLPALIATTVLASPVATASENDPVFLASQGRLVIPHLRLGNEIYFVILNRTNPNGYNFNLAGASVTNVTPRPGDDWASPSEVVGDWVSPDIPGVQLGIFASGAYSVVTPADEDCPAGTETGTWTMDESTGVFFAVAVTDGNSDCGLSHPDGAARVKRVGANLQVTFYEEENGMQQIQQVTLQPR